MSRQPRSTASSCLYAAARSSEVNVRSEVRSSHLPSRCVSRFAAARSMRSSPALAAQVAAQSRLGLQRPDQLVAFAGSPGVGAVDELLQVGDQVGPDGGGLLYTSPSPRDR